MQNGKLAASIARLGFYEFRQRLTTKIVASGGSVVGTLHATSLRTCGFPHLKLVIIAVTLTHFQAK